MLLSQMKENEICEIVAVKDGCHIKNRLSELGISKGQKIECKNIGLCRSPIAYQICSSKICNKKKRCTKYRGDIYMKSKKVLLMGNPNVGKSTVFNELTGMHQHTGNWTGKTVDSTAGKFYYKYNNYELIDLPGTYSLIPSSEEERIAGEYLLKEKYDCVVVVMDSTMLQRNLMLFIKYLR